MNLNESLEFPVTVLEFWMTSMKSRIFLINFTTTCCSFNYSRISPDYSNKNSLMKCKIRKSCTKYEIR